MSTAVGHSKKGAKPRTERRKARRQIVYIRFPASVRLEGDESGESRVMGVVTDLCKTGCGLILEEKLLIGTKIVITLTPDAPQSRTMSATVIWRSQLPTTGNVLKPRPSTSLDDPDGEAHDAGSYWRIGVKLDPEDKETAEFIVTLLKSL